MDEIWALLTVTLCDGDLVCNIATENREYRIAKNDEKKGKENDFEIFICMKIAETVDFVSRSKHYIKHIKHSTHIVWFM